MSNFTFLFTAAKRMTEGRYLCEVFRYYSFGKILSVAEGAVLNYHS